jgi:ATP-dependent Clp protease adaptor protein ClpS
LEPDLYGIAALQARIFAGRRGRRVALLEAIRISGSLPGGGGKDDDEGPPDLDENADVDIDVKSATPKRYKVIYHNDDYTTMEFVVETLLRFFHKTQAEATHIMLTVHTKGNAVAGVYTRDVAETKVENVMNHARENGMPLLVTSEPE